MKRCPVCIICEHTLALSFLTDEFSDLCALVLYLIQVRPCVDREDPSGLPGFLAPPVYLI
jgi:hypothetical protein